jgi:hypothetical protein
MGQLVAPVIDSFDKKFDSISDPTSRELTQFFHFAIALGRDSTHAEQVLRKCLDAQNMDAASKRYGTVPWRQNHPEIDDPNAIEFTLHGAAPALLLYNDRLPAEMRQYLKPHLVAGITAMRAHHVPVSYTNIYLMKATNLLLLGQYLSDPSAIADGKQMLTNWLAFVKENGITEYDSPTYASIVLNCLTPAHDRSNDADAKQLLKTCLDFVWADLAANYFSGQQTICGAQSRNYSFTSSINILCNNYYVEGLRETPGPLGLFNEGPDTYINAVESGPDGYHPDAELLALAHLPIRLIHQRVGAEPGMDRTTYITPDIAIGSASHLYGEQDRLINVQLASSKVLPDIAVVADEFDSPYGRVKRPDRTGHEKPVELKRTVSITQNEGTILALMNLVGAENRELDSVATNVLLPVQADAIWLNGSPVSTAQPFETAVPSDGVILVREGNSAVAIRILHADSVSGPAASTFLKWDGNDAQVARLVAYHYCGPKQMIPAQPIRVALLIRAITCTSDADAHALLEWTRSAQVQDETDGSNLWQVTTTSRQGREGLCAALHLATGAPTNRRVNGLDVSSSVFKVNGDDLIERIFAMR